MFYQHFMTSPLFFTSRRIVVAFLTSLFLSLHHAAAEEIVAEWDFNGAEIMDNTIVVPLTEGVAGDLVLNQNPAWRIPGRKLKKKTAPQAPMSFLLKVTLPWECSQRNPFSGMKDKIFVSISRVNPTGKEASYIVRSFCNFALQYDGKSRDLTLIAWFLDGYTDSVGIKISEDEWNTVTAQLSNGELSLTANGETKTKTVRSGAVLSKTNNAVWVANNVTNGEHSFAGKIAKLRLSKLP
jgi:hypothetical protein